MAMCLKDEVQMLKSVPMFSGLDPARLKLLAFASDVVTYGAGQTLMEQGGDAEHAFVILCGEADVLEDGDEGEVKVCEVGVKSIVGEAAILNEDENCVTVRARTPVTALRIGRDQFETLLASCPKTRADFARMVREREKAMN